MYFGTELSVFLCTNDELANVLWAPSSPETDASPWPPIHHHGNPRRGSLGPQVVGNSTVMSGHFMFFSLVASQNVTRKKRNGQRRCQFEMYIVVPSARHPFSAVDNMLASYVILQYYVNTHLALSPLSVCSEFA